MQGSVGCVRENILHEAKPEREACAGVWEIYSESTLIALVGCIKNINCILRRLKNDY